MTADQIAAWLGSFMDIELTLIDASAVALTSINDRPAACTVGFSQVDTGLSLDDDPATAVRCEIVAAGVVDKHTLLIGDRLDHLVLLLFGAVAVHVRGGEFRAAAGGHRGRTALVQHASFLVALSGASDRLVVAQHQRGKDNHPHHDDEQDDQARAHSGGHLSSQALQSSQ